jgi:MSHA biogenesis protein MshK
MAASLIHAHIPLYIAALIAVLLCCAPVRAQTLSDPTRPPGAVSPAGVDEGQARAPVLQSVIITSKGRAAIINGQRVELGGVYGDARVLKISETEVLLRSAGGTEVLKMYPNVDKRLGRRDAAPDAAKRRVPSKG